MSDLRNCRCCHASYEKPAGYWNEYPQYEDEKGNRIGIMGSFLKDRTKVKMIEPVGFCEFCDRNNKTWYTPNKPCHANNL